MSPRPIDPNTHPAPDASEAELISSETTDTAESPVDTKTQVVGNASAQAASRARRIGGSAPTAPSLRPASTQSSSDKPKLEKQSRSAQAETPARTKKVAPEGGVAAEVRASSKARLERQLKRESTDVPAVVDRKRLRIDDRNVQRWAIAGFASAVVAGLAIANVLVWHPWRDENKTPALRDQALASVKQSTASVLTYDYRSWDKYVADAAPQITGQFKVDYSKAMAGSIKTMAETTRTISVVKVDNAGLISINDKGTQATVMVYAERTVTNTANPDPKIDVFALRVIADRVNGKWLLSKLDYL